MAWLMISISVWRLGKNGGSVVELVASPAESVHQACFSAAWTVFRWATRSFIWPQQESPPPEASHIGAIEEANPHRRSPHQPPRRKRGEASSPRPRGKRPQNGLPIPDGGRLIWRVRKKIGTRLSPFPPPARAAKPTSAAAITMRSASESSLLEESLPGAKRLPPQGQCEQSAPSRDCTHSLFVSPLVM